MHLSAQLFEQMAGVKMTEVPYKGSGPAALDVLGGQVPLGVVDLPSALQHDQGRQADRVRGHEPAAPAATARRADARRSGLAGYDSTGWFGVVAPAGTPPRSWPGCNAEITAGARDPR